MSYTKYHNGSLKTALVVEQPSPLLDTYLQEQGMEVHRLGYVPNEEQLIAEINRVQAHAVFKRSRVKITRNILASCPSLLVIQLC